MKKAGMITLFFLMFVAASAQAQVNPGSVHITPTIGGYVFEGNEDMKNTLAVGLRAGYNFTRYFGIEGFAHYVPTEIQGVASSDKIHFFGYGVEGIVHLLPNSRLVPFIAAGFGGVHYSDATEDTTESKKNKFAADYGAGVKLFLAEHVAIRADVRHVLPMDKTHNNLLYTVGLTFAFGGAKKAPEPAPAPAPVAAKPAPVVAPPPPPPPPPEPKRVEPPKPVILEKGKVTLNVQFDTNRTVIKQGFYSDLDELGEVLNQYPDLKIEIEGHTDTVGTAAYNKTLSKARAEAVVKYLVDKHGIAASRLSAVGYGFDNPVATNATREGRQQNRRVDAVAEFMIKR